MDRQAFDELRERLFETTPLVVDFLPRQVPREGGKNFFAVERYLMAHPQIDELYGRFARFLVKLSCYYDIEMYDPQSDTWYSDPGPEELVQRVEACSSPGTDRYLQILLPGENAMLTLDSCDLYMALYHPRGELLETATKLAGAEGVFLRPSVPDELRQEKD